MNGHMLKTQDDNKIPTDNEKSPVETGDVYTIDYCYRRNNFDFSLFIRCWPFVYRGNGTFHKPPAGRHPHQNWTWNSGQPPGRVSPARQSVVRNRLSRSTALRFQPGKPSFFSPP